MQREHLGVRRMAPVLLAGVVLLGAGCGGDPDYCSDVSDLEQSVKDYRQRRRRRGRALRRHRCAGQGGGERSGGRRLGEERFPDQTDAITKSISDLKASAGQLSDSPTAQQVARATADVAVVASAVEDFVDATSSECD